MEAVAAPGDVRPTPLVEEQPPAPSAFFSEDLMELFVDIIDDEPTEPERVQDLNSARVDEGLESWETNSCSIQTNASRPETMLEFWMRQAKAGAYKQLVDVTQCPKIHPRDIDKFIPSNVKVGMEEDDAEGCELLCGYFSSVDDEDIDDTVT
ncbi:hypothetical protein L915_13553 [Phytophthora nicotianae]|uniref:Uncharacterized protein n=1 Tax=Phytophthora nicotianae TaxID=4792 RepID=W2ILP7_PHYNI|nr:hypothetical protein L915_13553 [Phytophthora nicotianae]ETL34303.1 hypothetical protein L916_13452 [Phytophthora nicotianae]